MISKKLVSDSIQALELNDNSENMFLNQPLSDDNPLFDPENHEHNQKFIKVEGSDGKPNGIQVQSYERQLIQKIRSIASLGPKLPGYTELPLKEQKQYKKATQQQILIDEVFYEQMNLQQFLISKFFAPHPLTPLIFTRKLPAIGIQKQKVNTPQWVNALEAILNLVVQLYYKKDFKIGENNSKQSILEETLKNPKSVEKRPGRKKKQVIETLDNNDNSVSNKEEDKRQSSNQLYQQIQQDILDTLVSPLRSDLPFEKWTTKEIAIFECAICKFGKQFEYIAELIQSKNAQDVIEFYFCWKFSSHYKIWKTHKSYYNRTNYNNYV